MSETTQATLADFPTALDRWCEVMHDVYEAAAVSEGRSA